VSRLPGLHLPAAAYRQLYIGRRMLNRHEPS
jgi:hypothetical protein